MAQRITIVGTGFAGLTAVRTLRRALPDAKLTVVSPKCELVYLPSLIWIPSGLRRADQLRVDLAKFFKRMRVQHVAAEATGLSADGRTLETTAGAIEHDGIIIASGGRFIKKLPGIDSVITPCEGIAAAEQIRERVRTLTAGTIALGFAGNPQEPNAMRGGPIFELLFGLDQQLRAERRRDQFRLLLFSPAERPGNRLGAKAVDRLLTTMAKRGIETHLGHKITGFADQQINTEGGNLTADLIIFMPGLTGNAWFDQTALARSPGGLLQADAQCRVVGAERVYVAGDAGSFPGPDWMPKQAHMADMQAATAARNLAAELNGQAPTATFKVELLCIVDTNDRGILVGRTEKHNFMLPPLRLLHWMKMFFEWHYLRPYR